MSFSFVKENSNIAGNNVIAIFKMVIVYCTFIQYENKLRLYSDNITTVTGDAWSFSSSYTKLLLFYYVPIINVFNLYSILIHLMCFFSSARLFCT